MEDDYNDYNDYSDNDNFAEEFAVHERVSTGLMGDSDVFQNPKDRFSRFVSIQVEYLIKKGYLSIEDREKLFDHIPNINKIEYKNATGYIFGYMVSGGGKNISKESCKRIFKISKIVFNNNDNIFDINVSEVDIIRYGRYWIKFLSSKIFIYVIYKNAYYV